MTLGQIVFAVIGVVCAFGFLAFDAFEARHGMHKR